MRSKEREKGIRLGSKKIRINFSFSFSFLFFFLRSFHFPRAGMVYGRTI